MRSLAETAFEVKSINRELRRVGEKMDISNDRIEGIEGNVKGLRSELTHRETLWRIAGKGAPGFHDGFFTGKNYNHGCSLTIQSGSSLWTSTSGWAWTRGPRIASTRPLAAAVYGACRKRENDREVLKLKIQR